MICGIICEEMPQNARKAFLGRSIPLCIMKKVGFHGKNLVTLDLVFFFFCLHLNVRKL